MQRIWERSCRRADLPIAYSQGFHPQARIQQAAPLPLGMEGLNEIVDIWFQDDVDFKVLTKQLNRCLPIGIVVESVKKVALNESSLQSRVYSASYLIRNIQSESVLQLPERINEIINSTSIQIEKKGRYINVRDLIKNVRLQNISNTDKTEILMDLKHMPGKTGRPEDILQLIGIDPREVRIIRVRLYY